LRRRKRRTADTEKIDGEMRGGGRRKREGCKEGSK
jgi:hypothetical protein